MSVGSLSAAASAVAGSAVGSIRHRDPVPLAFTAATPSLAVIGSSRLCPGRSTTDPLRTDPRGPRRRTSAVS